MKKSTTYFVALFALSTFMANAQNQTNDQAEKAPNADRAEIAPAGKTEALWDVQKNFNITSAANGNVGMAAVMFFNNQYWVSEWAGDTILRYSATGTLVDKFVIPGLTGTRSLSTDGTNVYAGTAAGTIFRINPGTKQLAPPHITLTGGIVARFCAYDHTLNGGAGGFWVGNFNTAIDAVSMTGTSLTSIPAATHGLTGMYGAAADNHTAGGPYLWVFHQGGANACQVTKITLPSGTPTGITRDAFQDVSSVHSLTSGLAGGAFLSDDIVPGMASLACLVQGSPSNVIVVYELGASQFDIEENASTRFSAYPNPTKGVVTISLKENVQNASYELMDATGRVVRSGTLSDGETTINIEDVAAGNYMLTVFESGSKMAEQKIVKM